MSATTLTDRAVVRLSGEDVRGFLQGLVTSDVAGDLPVWTGLLTPQGKCLFDFLVWSDGDDLLLDCEAEAADDLIKRLMIYRLRRPIRIERDPSVAVHWAKNGSEGVSDPRLSKLGGRWLAVPDEPASGWLEHRLRLGVTEGRAELGDLLWLECNAIELNGVSFSKGCFVGQENTARMNWRA
ncbi:MAG TPA: folate-binding protein, partial [Sphingomicrobium sp.]|nr:folate-binding protein [Sphingomicrobium sp.]